MNDILYYGLIAFVCGLGLGLAFCLCQAITDVWCELKSRYYIWKRAEDKRKINDPR